MEASQILARTPLFSELLDAEEVRLLAAQTRPALFRAGTRLMNQGDFGGSMFVIVAGEVAVDFVGRDARETSVAKLGPGDIVGEMSLFTGDRRTATVSAVSNVEALEITKSALERVFSKAPKLVDGFTAVLARRQAELAALSPSVERAATGVFLRQARHLITEIFRARS